MDIKHVSNPDSKMKKKTISSVLKKLATGIFIILIVGITAFTALCLAMLFI